MQDIESKIQHLRLGHEAGLDRGGNAHYQLLDSVIRQIVKDEEVHGLTNKKALRKMPFNAYQSIKLSAIDTEAIEDYEKILAILKLAQNGHKQKGASLLIALFRAAYEWGSFDGYALCSRKAGSHLKSIEKNLDSLHKRRTKDLVKLQKKSEQAAARIVEREQAEIEKFINDNSHWTNDKITYSSYMLNRKGN